METKDLILRDWQDSDAQALYKMSLDPAFRKSGVTCYDSVLESRDTIHSWKTEPGFKAITCKEDHAFVGMICLGEMNRYAGYMELEFAIASEYRNLGYATQAVKRMVEYGFRDLHLSVIAAWVRSHNVESSKVLEKCAFTLEGRLRKHARDQSDTLCYSILREEWERVDAPSY